MLFKCNEQNEPESLILVDYQLCREICPTLELSYFIYSGSGASSVLRQSILDELLETYYTTFMEVCKAMNCDPLPGFSLNALRYRFYRMTPVGAALSTLLTPIMLLNSDDAKDFEKDVDTANSGDVGDMIKGLTDIVFTEGDKAFKTRMIDMTKEFYDIGVL